MAGYNFDADDLVRRSIVTEEALKALQDDRDTPESSRELLCLFLVACDNDLDASRKALRSYRTIRRDCVELFRERDLSRDDVRESAQNMIFALLPCRTASNSAIIYHSAAKDSTPANFNFGATCKLLMMTVDRLLMETDPVSSVIFLFDMENMSLGHVRRVKVDLLRKVMQYVETAMPLKMSSIHVLNAFKLVEVFFGMIRPFVRSDFMKKVVIHHKMQNMDDFFAKHIPKDCMPSDFGGTQPLVQQLHTENLERLQQLHDWFQREEKQHSTS